VTTPLSSSSSSATGNGRHQRLPHDPESDLLEADPLGDLQQQLLHRPIAVLSDPIADRQLRRTIKHIDNCSISVNCNKQQSLQSLIPPAPPPPAAVRSSSSRHSSPCLRTAVTNSSTTLNNNNTSVASSLTSKAVAVSGLLSSPESNSQLSNSARSRQKLVTSRSTSSSSAVSQDCYRSHDMSEKLL